LGWSRARTCNSNFEIGQQGLRSTSVPNVTASAVRAAACVTRAAKDSRAASSGPRRHLAACQARTRGSSMSYLGAAGIARLAAAGVSVPRAGGSFSHKNPGTTQIVAEIAGTGRTGPRTRTVGVVAPRPHRAWQRRSPRRARLWKFGSLKENIVVTRYRNALRAQTPNRCKRDKLRLLLGGRRTARAACATPDHPRARRHPGAPHATPRGTLSAQPPPKPHTHTAARTSARRRMRYATSGTTRAHAARRGTVLHRSDI
jgi:hypothetical protein